MNILVINCGSSSLKFQLIDSETEKCIAKGLCERIGIDGRLVYEPKNGEKEVTEAAMPPMVVRKSRLKLPCRIIPKLSVWCWKL